MEICGVLAGGRRGGGGCPAPTRPLLGGHGGSARVQPAVETGSHSYPGEGEGSLDLDHWEVPTVRGGGSDNPEAGEQGRLKAPPAEVTWSSKIFQAETEYRNSGD